MSGQFNHVALFSAIAMSAAVPTNGLFSYYRLRENSQDIVGGLNGTDTSITYNAAYGPNGGGAGFDGVSSVIGLPNIDIGGAGGRSLWMTALAVGASADTVLWESNPAASAFDPRAVLNFSTGSGLAFVYQKDSSVTQANVSAGVPVANTRYHIAYTWDTNVFRIWKNGVLIAEDLSGGVKAAQVSTARRFGQAASVGINGYLAEVAMYSRQLVQADIDALWNGGAGSFL